MRPYLIASALLLAAAVGCESPTSPTVPDAFVAVLPRQDPATLQSFSAGAADRSVIIDGHIITSDPCHGFAATTARRDGRLTVTLHARPNSVGCLAPAGESNYRITVQNVPAGEWTVIVRHSYAADAPGDTVLTSPVVVPPAA